MDELEQFEAVLRELGELMLDLGDLASRVMLIGGQALALEARKRDVGCAAFAPGTGALPREQGWERALHSPARC